MFAVCLISGNHQRVLDVCPRSVLGYCRHSSVIMLDGLANFTFKVTMHYVCSRRVGAWIMSCHFDAKYKIGIKSFMCLHVVILPTLWFGSHFDVFIFMSSCFSFKSTFVNFSSIILMDPVYSRLYRKAVAKTFDKLKSTCQILDVPTIVVHK